MTDKTEAQPEALRLAAWLNEGAWHQMRLGDVLAAGRELRRQHAEIQQLKAQLSARQAAPDWIEDLAQSWDECMYDAPGEMIDIGASIRKAASRVAPPPPEREPLTEQEILEAVSSLYAHPALRSMGAADDIATARAIERAHGIGATND
ncbi:hypothetical protein [Comamonas sp.]|uniref:hypothetical protein n=1 Tax=Comamonas sp. TaxID=34028 RepID=UPI0028A0D602|nr:hypothetical protein [Comamonas sp.]